MYESNELDLNQCYILFYFFSQRASVKHVKVVSEPQQLTPDVWYQTSLGGK